MRFVKPMETVRLLSVSSCCQKNVKRRRPQRGPDTKIFELLHLAHLIGPFVPRQGEDLERSICVNRGTTSKRSRFSAQSARKIVAA